VAVTVVTFSKLYLSSQDLSPRLVIVWSSSCHATCRSDNTSGLAKTTGRPKMAGRESELKYAGYSRFELELEVGVKVGLSDRKSMMLCIHLDPCSLLVLRA
jgi:hypothetical protein